MNEFSDILWTEDKKGKCYMILWNPLLGFTKEKHKDSGRPGKDGGYGGATALRVLGEFKVSEESNHPTDS